MLTVSVLVLGCATAPPGPTDRVEAAGSRDVARGGTVRVVVPTVEIDNFAYHTRGFLDPVQDGSRGSRELLRCCLARTLYSYNGLSIEEGGARVQPDLATTLPEVSADGQTWTIRLRPGLHWGPPLEGVEISSADVIRGLQRSLSLFKGAGAPTRVMDIIGAAEYAAGSAPSISGLSAPDAYTVVIRLVRPAGDLAAALAAPNTAPIPPNPAKPGDRFGVAEGTGSCSGTQEVPGCGYGSFLVSSGPYMLEGSEDLDFTVPASRRPPASGVSHVGIRLVRNPSWDPATDALRPAYVDRITITLPDSMDAAVAALGSGQADLLWNPVTPPTVPVDAYAAFEADPARGRAHVDRAPVTRYVVMNVALPPFDDVHVRKALNWIIDKQDIVDLLGGPSAAGVIGHLAPDGAEDGLLMDYDPYASDGERGDPAAARAEMVLSRYDTNGDGRCDVAACRQVKAVTREPFGDVGRAVARGAALLGIELEITVSDLNTFIDSAYDPTQKVPVFIGLGYSNPTGDSVLTSFRSGLLAGVSPSLVGATAEQLRAWGYDVTTVPNVDDRLDACASLAGAARFSCDASLDQYLMEVVVPMVPFSQDRFTALTSPRVVNYAFDELIGTTSIDHIALAP